MKAYFGKDHVDGWPIGPVSLVQNQTFFYDPHSDCFQRLWMLANSSKYTTGTAGTAAVAPVPGSQTAWYRERNGIPGTNNNVA
jgi:hypothetical protein